MTFLQIGPVNATQLAIEKACNLLDHYNLLKEDGMFDNSNTLHIFLEQNVLEACTVWVSANVSPDVCFLQPAVSRCMNIEVIIAVFSPAGKIW